MTITANSGTGNLAAFRSALSRVQFSTTTIGDGNRSVSFVVTDNSGLAGVAGATSFGRDPFDHGAVATLGGRSESLNSLPRVSR